MERSGGRSGVAKFFEVLGTTQSAQTLRIEETYAAGDQVISIGRYSCIVNGTGKTIDSAVAHIFTVKNGQVVRLLDFIDTALAVEAYTPVMAGAGGLTFQARADICWSA
ncbi:MAG TPA: nuclear transport factor 2 family protein [Bryobacteraceae bacterium]|nr:nuclear transport factor 2 family protein [Bryobacteraceae bacterium]